jgi:hypothetical protein
MRSAVARGVEESLVSLPVHCWFDLRNKQTNKQTTNKQTVLDV